MHLKVYNAYLSFTKFGGAEKVAISIHEGLKEQGYDSKLLAFNDFSKNISKYNIKNQDNVS
jgi:hypothetical protein